MEVTDVQQVLEYIKIHSHNYVNFYFTAFFCIVSFISALSCIKIKKKHSKLKMTIMYSIATVIFGYFTITNFMW